MVRYLSALSLYWRLDDMREISQETQEILKSQRMLGVNKYNYELKLEGLDMYSDIKDSYALSFSDGSYGDFCVRSDGKILSTYRKDNKIMLSVTDTEDDLLTIPNISVNDAWEFDTVSTYNNSSRSSILLRLKNGKILFFIYERGNTVNTDYSVKVYISENGLGTDFESPIIIDHMETTNYSSMTYDSNGLGKAIQIKSGRVIIPVIGPFILQGIVFKHSYILYSDDMVNWHKKVVRTSTISALVSYLGDKFDGIAEFENGRLSAVVGVTAGSGYAYVYESNDNGVTWYSVGNMSIFNNLGVGHGADSAIYSDSDGYIYLYFDGPTTGGILYRKKSDIYPQNIDYYNINNDWENLLTMPWQEYGGAIFFVTPKGTIIIVGSFRSFGRSTIYGFTREEYSAPIKASSISISKGRGGANTLSLSIDNSNGAINPKNQESPLYNIINLNKQIIVKQGYGSDLIETFTGLIDSFQMKSYPHTMEISCRDHLKKALDQTITEAGSHTVSFESQPIESIFGYLCYLAGIETGEIDETGITISKEFSWQTYADAFQFLADLASFEYGADEYGKVYFKRDYQPDEITIAYTFEEGLDITSLSYQLADNDLYYMVKVYGKSGDNVISYSAPFPDAAKYNIMPQKILKVDATEASTLTELKKIADRSIYLMNSRTAIVNFSAVAVPWLQVGDFIQVNESSSMSAGIYRISSLNLKMTDKDFLMDLQCYYYGDSIETGTLPEDTATQTGDPLLNLIPEMTSNTSPSGVARASSVLILYDNDYQPWNALNSTSEDLYWNAVSQYGWIEYQFAEKTIIDKYMLKARQAIDYNKAMPKNWTFEGFDGEKWITLDTQSNQTAWGIHEERSFNFDNTTAYAKYRLNVSANNGFHRLQLEQLAMYYRGGA